MATNSQKYQDISIEESVEVAQRDARDAQDDEKSATELHRRANALMGELSRVESELGTIMVTIRSNANSVMSRAVYEEHLKRNERRSMYFFIFMALLIAGGMGGIVAAAYRGKT